MKCCEGHVREEESKPSLRLQRRRWVEALLSTSAQCTKPSNTFPCLVLTGMQPVFQTVRERREEHQSSDLSLLLSSAVRSRKTMPEAQIFPQCDDHMPHDIFLSHSGKQKPFAKDLCNELRRNTFNTFFDTEHHSLPPGEHFPTHIFQAAKCCKVALVLLSEEFVCSKWPMTELCTFVDAMASGVKLLPLFFKLSTEDLKCLQNLERWRAAWRGLEIQAGQSYPINVSEWEKALAKLGAQSGVVFDKETEGELRYIDKIVSAVSEILPPAIQTDTTYIAGKDRLCQVILEKFERMKCSKRKESASTSSSSGHKVTCVLGLYGPPGSGKSTLCKCLLGRLTPLFGRSLYLELSPTLPNDEVVNKLMQLRYLTTFRDRFHVDGRKLDLREVKSLLERFGLPSCQVLLVVDYISDRSREAVRSILQLGFGHGSKIILVAHTFDALRAIFVSLKRLFPDWACDSMAVPSISKKEASEILLHTVRPSSAFFDDVSVSMKMQIVERIVGMCCYSEDWEDGRREVHLPLVMEAVGARLLLYVGDLEKWEGEQRNFWRKVESYEQDAIIDMLEKNFRALPNESLQLLFLDVVLFILEFEQGIVAVTEILSVLHGIRTSRIKTMIKDLARHCFLTHSKYGTIGVHGVYMKFAKSFLGDGPSRFVTTSMRSWCWSHCQIPEGATSFLLKENFSSKDKGELRALVLKVGESCQRVDLQGFSGLQAVVLRNGKLLVVLGLAGLSSLAVLEIRDCASFERLDCNYDSNFSSLLNIRRFVCIGESKALAHVQVEERMSYLQALAKLMKRLIAPFRQPDSLEMALSRMSSLQALHLEKTGIARLECFDGMWPLLRDLRVHEENLESFQLGYLPNLEKLLFCDVASIDLTGIDWDEYEWSDPSLGISSNPWRLDRDEYEWDYPSLYKSSNPWRLKYGNEKYLLPGKDSLSRCPQLKQVRMMSSFFKQGQLGSLPASLVNLRLHFFYLARELPNLSLSGCMLEFLEIMVCDKLERINLDIGLKCLKTLHLFACQSLVEVIGLESLSNLRVLVVAECRKLERLEGLENSASLEVLDLIALGELTEISWVSSLGNLESLTLIGCPKAQKSVAEAHTWNLGKLREFTVELFGECCLNLSKCKSLKKIIVGPHAKADGILKLEGLDKLVEPSIDIRIEHEGHTPPHHENLRTYFRARHLDARPSIGKRAHVAIAKPMSSLHEGVFSLDLAGCAISRAAVDLDKISCDKVQDKPGGTIRCRISLVELPNTLMEGVEHLGTLDFLHVQHRNLRSLRGLQSLIQLRSLSIRSCPMLEEMPSLRALVHMEEIHICKCPKLKAFEGCDYMTQLRKVSFIGCKSMKRLPFSDHVSDLTNLTSLSTKGCGFCSDVPYMAAWVAAEEDIPACLRWQALKALLEEYYGCPPEKEKKKDYLAKVLLWCMLRLLPSSSSDFSWLEQTCIYQVKRFIEQHHRHLGEGDLPSLRTAVHRLAERLRDASKTQQQRREFLHQQPSHFQTSSLLHFLHDRSVAKYICPTIQFVCTVANSSVLCFE